MTQTSSSTAIIPGFPLWRYLRQLLFHSTTILNPLLFWYRYQLQVHDPNRNRKGTMHRLPS